MHDLKDEANMQKKQAMNELIQAQKTVNTANNDMGDSSSEEEDPYRLLQPVLDQYWQLGVQLFVKLTVHERYDEMRVQMRALQADMNNLTFVMSRGG